MNFLNILFAVLILGALGILFGALLAFASRVFAVEKDNRADNILEVLPGANCGGCGYAGCSNFAAALVDGTAQLNDCPVTKEEGRKKIAEILGIQLTRNENLQALVRCSGGVRVKNRFAYDGIKDCHAANKLAGGTSMCQHGCLGFGSCVAACKFDALKVLDGVAVVDSEKCTGCLKCIEECPRGVIVPVPYHTDVNVLCSSHEKGASLKNICEIGCIGCRICEKACEAGAIHVEDNLATIDYDKCTTCGVCAEKCPRHLIVNLKLKHKFPEKNY